MYYEAGLYENVDLDLPRAAYSQAEMALERAADYGYIPGWNDRLGQTKETIIDKMKEAAKELRNRA